MSVEDDVKWPMDPDQNGVMLKVGDWVINSDLSPDPRIITSISSRGALSTKSADGSITGITWPKYVSRVSQVKDTTGPGNESAPISFVSASLHIRLFSPVLSQQMATMLNAFNKKANVGMPRDVKGTVAAGGLVWVTESDDRTCYKMRHADEAVQERIVQMWMPKTGMIVVLGATKIVHPLIGRSERWISSWGV